MNKQLKNQLNTYKRTLENKRAQSFIYSFLLVFILVVLDIAGIYSLVRLTRRKLKTFSELSKITVDMEIKVKKFNELEEKLRDSKLYISELNKAIPKERQVDSFAVKEVELSARNGMKHKRLRRLNEEENYVDVRLTLQGASAQIHPFISDLESLDRLVVVKSFDYKQEEQTAYLEVEARLFYLRR